MIILLYIWQMGIVLLVWRNDNKKKERDNIGFWIKILIHCLYVFYYHGNLFLRKHIWSRMLSLFHFALMNLYSFLFTVERKDQKTLEKLRAERKAKIDELKERTNYYLTQQLIQVSGQVSITQATKIHEFQVSYLFSSLATRY